MWKSYYVQWMLCDFKCYVGDVWLTITFSVSEIWFDLNYLINKLVKVKNEVTSKNLMIVNS